MSKPALLNVALIAANIGAAELEFAVKKVHVLDVMKKGPTDYVTEVDTKVEEIVFDEIKKYYPEDNFLGEESGHEVNNSDTTWVLDPIDGTTNFIHGYPQYCISLACVVNGQTQHAVIIDPTRREEFSASRGKGAELNGERIRVSKRAGIKDALLGNTSHINESQNYSFDNIASFRALYKHGLTIRRSGCSALDLAYVAAGRLDGFWANGLSIWDVAAGLLIAQESGALTSNFVGNPDVTDSDHYLCASPKCFKSMLEAIQPNFQVKEA
jgi:myo-inositol-1(or 4)-monophosphatase|tara:strand:+ start:174 stop:980 length:807 start_codon:yes stop_codon:yes gene_type:complete